MSDKKSLIEQITDSVMTGSGLPPTDLELTDDKQKALADAILLIGDIVYPSNPIGAAKFLLEGLKVLNPKTCVCGKCFGGPHPDPRMN